MAAGGLVGKISNTRGLCELCALRLCGLNAVRQLSVRATHTTGDEGLHDPLSVPPWIELRLPLSEGAPMTGAPGGAHCQEGPSFPFTGSSHEHDIVIMYASVV